MATVEKVRYKAGTPVAGDFASGLGTPVVVNTTTGQCYVLNDAGAIVEIGTTNPAIAALLALLTVGNANKTVKINAGGTAFVAV